MKDPTDNDVTLPLSVTAECEHGFKVETKNGVFSAQVTQDLLGNWILLRNWGQLSKPVASVEEGVALLTKLHNELAKKLAKAKEESLPS